MYPVEKNIPIPDGVKVSRNPSKRQKMISDYIDFFQSLNIGDSFFVKKEDALFGEVVRMRTWAYKVGIIIATQKEVKINEYTCMPETIGRRIWRVR